MKPEIIMSARDQKYDLSRPTLMTRSGRRRDSMRATHAMVDNGEKGIVVVVMVCVLVVTVVVVEGGEKKASNRSIGKSQQHVQYCI